MLQIKKIMLATGALVLLAGVWLSSRARFPDLAGTLLFFSAPWCSHCTRFKGDWQRLQTMAGGEAFRLREVPEGSAPALNERFAVHGYPTLVLVDRQGARHDFSGPRTAEALLAFARAEN